MSGTGHFLTDGFQSLISFAKDNAPLFYEIEVTPPSVGIGKPIPVSTMRNTKYNTFASSVLLTLGQMKVQVAYNPTTITADIIAQVGVNQLITVTFPDGSTLAFYGYLDMFTPSSLVEGKRPTAEIIIQPTLRNTANPPVETAPVVTGGS